MFRRVPWKCSQNVGFGPIPLGGGDWQHGTRHHICIYSFSGMRNLWGGTLVLVQNKWITASMNTLLQQQVWFPVGKALLVRLKVLRRSMSLQEQVLIEFCLFLFVLEARLWYQCYHEHPTRMNWQVSALVVWPCNTYSSWIAACTKWQPLFSELQRDEAKEFLWFVLVGLHGLNTQV